MNVMRFTLRRAWIAALLGVLLVVLTVTALLPGSRSKPWALSVSYYNGAGDNGATNLSDIACPSPSMCLAVGLSGDFSHGVIFRTSDAGRRWTVRHLPNVGLNSISCPTMEFCAVAGFSLRPSTPSGGEIWTTPDSGARWTRASLPIGVAPAVGTVYCSADGHCIAEAQASSLISEILRSTDHGLRWFVVLRLPRGVTLGPVTCASPSLCFAGGSHDSMHAEILRSTDGGARWSPQLPISEPGAYVQGISCPSRSECVAVGFWSPASANIETLASGNRGAIWTTHDAGLSWTPVAVPVATGELSGVSCVTNRVCEAVGQNVDGTGADVKSNDSGWGWFTHASIGTTVALESIACVSRLRCWVTSTGPTEPNGGGVIFATR